MSEAKRDRLLLAFSVVVLAGTLVWTVSENHPKYLPIYASVMALGVAMFLYRSFFRKSS